MLLRVPRCSFGLLGASGSEDAKFHSSSSVAAGAAGAGDFDGPARAANGSAAGAGAAAGGAKACWAGWGVMDWDPGGEEKEANEENAGLGSATEPVALLSWVIDDKRAGPGMSTAVSILTNVRRSVVLTLIRPKA